MSNGIDWESIERAYSLNTRSNCEIASVFGVSEGAIRKKAKKLGWARDLQGKVKIKTEQKVREIEHSYQSTNTRLEEKAVIEKEAEKNANIHIKHRKTINRYQSLGEKLIGELELQTGELATFEKLGELMAAPNENGYDKLHEQYKKVLATPSRIDSFKKAAETLKTLIGLERQAHGIADNANGDADVQDITEIVYTVIYPDHGTAQA